MHGFLLENGFSETEIGSQDSFLSKIEDLRMSVIPVDTTKPKSVKAKNSLDNYSFENDVTAKTESKYKGNKLANGSSPLDGCFGKGIYRGNATLTIKNGSSSDAIVCLYNVSSGRTIRNEYVLKNSNFTMDKIEQGYYKIRVLFGNDWNPTRTNACGTKGDFDSDVSFSEFDESQFFEDSENGYTVATITLYSVSNGNASTSSISRSEFFNK